MYKFSDKKLLKQAKPKVKE